MFMLCTLNHYYLCTVHNVRNAMSELSGGHGHRYGLSLPIRSSYSISVDDNAEVDK